MLIGEGLLDKSGELTAKVVKPCKCVIVSDDTVDELYGDRAQISFSYAGFDVSRFAFPAGEASKNLDTLRELLNAMGEAGLTRSDLVVALGGGVTGDMAGFAAAIYARGIRFVQIPTTLLAAVDSSVGGKTAVDMPFGKNMVGAFHQPSLVVTDTDVLRELPAGAAVQRRGGGDQVRRAERPGAVCAAGDGRLAGSDRRGGRPLRGLQAGRGGRGRVRHRRPGLPEPGPHLRPRHRAAAPASRCSTARPWAWAR